VIFGQFINKITLSLNAPHNYNKFGLAKRPVLRMLSQYQQSHHYHSTTGVAGLEGSKPKIEI
jgi:hypothetical protein